MREITSPVWLYLKGLLCALLGAVAATLILLESPRITTAAFLAIAVWAFARAYYFAFYVVEHYVDPSYKFAGLGHFARYVAGRRRARNIGPGSSGQQEVRDAPADPLEGPGPVA